MTRKFVKRSKFSAISSDNAIAPSLCCSIFLVDFQQVYCHLPSKFFTQGHFCENLEWYQISTFDLTQQIFTCYMYLYLLLSKPHGSVNVKLLKQFWKWNKNNLSNITPYGVLKMIKIALYQVVYLGPCQTSMKELFWENS